MKPLSKKIRRRVLWFLLFTFLLCTPVLIGYSRGYRIDDALGVIQTGGIYLHSDIPYTSVYLDDEFVENNGALLRNTFIEGLLPNRYYAVRVERPEYQSWVKVLRVEPKLVTEAKIFMLPKVFEWVMINATSTLTMLDTETGISTTTEVTNPEYLDKVEFFEEDHDQFEVEVATSTYEYIRGIRYPSTTIVTEIRYPDWLVTLASSSKLAEKEMVREHDGIVTWLEHGDLYAVWARENDVVPYYFCSEGGCQDQLAIQWEDDILRYNFYPNRNDVVIVLTRSGLYVVELDNRSQRNIQTIIEEPNLDFRLLDINTLAIFDGSHFRVTEL